nr:hypothetical protein [Tanacetum cinerariifolium]
MVKGLIDILLLSLSLMRLMLALSQLWKMHLWEVISIPLHQGPIKLPLQKVHSLESELKDYKKLFKDAVEKLVKKVKALEVKLKTKKRKMVMSDSDQEDSGKQDMDLDALRALANAAVTIDSNIPSGGTLQILAASLSISTAVPLGTSVVPLGTFFVPTGAFTAPAGSPNVPTNVPSSAALAGVSSKGKALIVEEDILVKARTFKQMEEDRLGEEAAKQLHDEEMAQMERQRVEIRKVQSSSQIQAFSRTLKRPSLMLEESSSKRQQSTEAPIPSMPEVPHSPAVSLPPSSRTRRKSLSLKHILKPKTTLLKLDLDADAKTFIKVVVNEDSDDDDYGDEEIRSWRLYTLSNVHVLETMYGEVLSMFTDVSYPLLVKLMERMLMHKLEIDSEVVGNDMTTTEQLIQFIKSQLAAAQASFFELIWAQGFQVLKLKDQRCQERILNWSLHGYSDGDEYDNGSNVDNVTLISKVDVSHPLHLHPNDFVALTVVFVKLKGTKNYQVLSCAMLLAFEGKNKLDLLMVLVEETYDKVDGSKQFDALIELPRCTCHAADDFKKHNQLMKLMQFRTGLDDTYMQIRSSILSRETLSNVRSVYAIISNEESHIIATNSVSGTSQRPNDNRNMRTDEGSTLVCENCGFNGHTVDRCFEIIGYPPNFGKKKVSRPNGTEAFITKIKNMPLTDYLTLFDVLVVLEYCVSLMSVQKVARDSKLVITFYELKCYVLNQDLKAGKVLGTSRHFGLNNKDFFILDGSIDHFELPYNDERSDPSLSRYSTPSSHSGSTFDIHNKNEGGHSMGSDAAASENDMSKNPKDNDNNIFKEWSLNSFS